MRATEGSARSPPGIACRRSTPEVLVAAPRGLPFVVRAGLEHGLSEDVRPLLLAGQGDDYSRATFLLFEPARSNRRGR